MNPKNKKRTKTALESVKNKDTPIEQLLAKTLWRKGYRYRKNDKRIFGRPDLSFYKLKIAIFVDGEFWHGYNWVEKKHDHKTNVSFWHSKIERNMKRDILVNQKLRESGWVVIRFWGKEVKNNLEECISIIEDEIKRKL